MVHGIVYKIEGGGLSYVGSTTLELTVRFSQHKSKTNITSSKIIFEICDDPTVDIIEEGEFETIEDLRSKEYEYISKTDNCVNIKKGQSYDPRYFSEYYKKNREHMNYTRKCNSVMKNYSFIRKEDCDVWFKNRPLLKLIYRSKSNISKEELIKIIEQIYEE